MVGGVVGRGPLELIFELGVWGWAHALANDSIMLQLNASFLIKTTDFLLESCLRGAGKHAD